MANDLLATVVSDLEFRTPNGSTVCMKENEQLLVLEKTNNKWWKVVRSGQQQPFYAPTSNLRERTVSRVRLPGGHGSVRDRRRAPLSAIDAERHISGHDAESGGWGGWESAAASPVPRSSSMDDVLSEGPARAADRPGHSWHRRQSWAPERHGDPRGAAALAGPPDPPWRCRSGQQDVSGSTGAVDYGEGGGRPLPTGSSSTWERRGPPPVPPGASNTWERNGTGGARAAPYGASNTWERNGRSEPHFASGANNIWERKGTSGPLTHSSSSSSSTWERAGDGGNPVPFGASNTWERSGSGRGNSMAAPGTSSTWERRDKGSVRVRGPMAMSWQTEKKQAPLPPPRTRHAPVGPSLGPSEPGGLSVGRGGIINQSAPSLAFDAIDARRPSVGSLAARRTSPSSLSDLRALRPDLSDGHNEGYRRTAERLAGRSESPRPPAVVAVADRAEGLRAPAAGTERPLGRAEETAPVLGHARPAVPPRPSRRAAAAATEPPQPQPQPQPQLPPAVIPVDRSGRPPVPHMLDTPRRQLTGSWAEYDLPATDGSYFYNAETGVSSWLPPQMATATLPVPDDGELSSCESLYSESESCSDSPLCSPRLGPGPAADVPLPDGWRRRRDTLGEFCFVRDTSPTRWYSGQNADDHVYFFAEGSSESQWSLPAAHGTSAPAAADRELEQTPPRSLPAVPPPPAVRPAKGPPPPKPARKPTKPTAGVAASSDLGCGWPQLRAGEAPLLVIRQGTLSCRIKLTRRKGAGGKELKQWRHWAPCHLALTDSYLLLFTDVKDPASIRWGSPSHLPVVTVHLAGASLVTDSTASSKKNVLQLTTRTGTQLLLRDDNATTVQVWADALHTAISNLPGELKPLLPPIVAPKPQAQRSPSTRRANDVGSQSATETEPAGSLEPPAGLTRENSRIRRRLKGFFSARPSPEELKQSGILKDERVFGRSLTAVCEADRSPVPRFVQHCIEAIEAEPGSLRTEGLYRVSAGLDQIQRVRCQVDQENYSVLATESDPHVLAGALKLFFRELPQPLLPGGELAEAALCAAETGDTRQRVETLRRLVGALEPAHRDTLEVLLRHLNRVMSEEACNRMGARNLAVVFGPTLTRPPEGDPLLHTADVMRQNVLVEALLENSQRVLGAG